MLSSPYMMSYEPSKAGRCAPDWVLYLILEDLKLWEVGTGTETKQV